MFAYKKTMDRLLQQEIAKNQVKGASALVLHKGKEIYYGAFGLADIERQIPMQRDTIIHLYSMSKPITAAAVMILVERGELDLRDDIARYLPWFKETTVWSEGREVPMERPITVFDILHMTSGITYPDENTEPGRRMKALVDDFVARRERGERVTTMDYMQGMASVPLVFQPGSKWMYGFSADVCGAVVEAVAGMPFGEFLKKELFIPLQMPDTGFFVPEEKKNRLAVHYDVTAEGEFIPHTGSHLGEYYEADVAFESGGAGMVSTLDDYAHFAGMLAAGGTYRGQRILGRKTVEYMRENHLTPAQKVDFNWDSLWGYGYGTLMRVLEDRGAAGTNATVGEFGWDGWTGNYVTMDPTEDLVLLYFIQRTDSGMTPIVRKLRMATYASIE